jgi:hypothetical protein
MRAVLNFGLRVCTGELRPLASHVQPLVRARGAGMFSTLGAVKLCIAFFVKTVFTLTNGIRFEMIRPTGSISECHPFPSNSVNRVGMMCI